MVVVFGVGVVMCGRVWVSLCECGCVGLCVCVGVGTCVFGCVVMWVFWYVSVGFWLWGLWFCGCECV